MTHQEHTVQIHILLALRLLRREPSVVGESWILKLDFSCSFTDETKLRESFSFSAKDIAKFNRLFQPEKYPPLESEFSEEQDDIVPIHITKACKYLMTLYLHFFHSYFFGFFQY